MRKIKREKREFKIGTKNPESLDVLHTGFLVFKNKSKIEIRGKPPD